MKGWLAPTFTQWWSCRDPWSERTGNNPGGFHFLWATPWSARAPSLTFLSGRVSYLSAVPMMMFSFMNTHSQRQAEGDYYKPSACAQNAVGPLGLKRDESFSRGNRQKKEWEDCRSQDANCVDLEFAQFVPSVFQHTQLEQYIKLRVRNRVPAVFLMDHTTEYAKKKTTTLYFGTGPNALFWLPC